MFYCGVSFALRARIKMGGIEDLCLFFKMKFFFFNQDLFFYLIFAMVPKEGSKLRDVFSDQSEHILSVSADKYRYLLDGIIYKSLR